MASRYSDVLSPASGRHPAEASRRSPWIRRWAWLGIAAQVVFVAGVLANARGLPESEIRQILEDERSDSFRFGPEHLQWRDVAASIDEIAHARREWIISFGSCSFDEPRDDLRALGLL